MPARSSRRVQLLCPATGKAERTDDHHATVYYHHWLYNGSGIGNRFAIDAHLHEKVGPGDSQRHQHTSHKRVAVPAQKCPDILEVEGRKRAQQEVKLIGEYHAFLIETQQATPARRAERSTLDKVVIQVEHKHLQSKTTAQDQARM